MKNPLKSFDTKETIKLSLTALATGTIWFYTGPIASMAARQAFQYSYHMLYGIPHWYNPSYALTYMPLREHVSHYAYEYGGLMLGSLCAPIIYKGINTAGNVGQKMIGYLSKPEPVLQFSGGVKADQKDLGMLEEAIENEQSKNISPRKPTKSRLS